MDNYDDGQWFNDYDMAHELEVHIITTDGAQHLRLNGFLNVIKLSLKVKQ